MQNINWRKSDEKVNRLVKRRRQTGRKRGGDGEERDGELFLQRASHESRGVKEAEKTTTHSKAASEAQIETIPGGIYSTARRKTLTSDGEQAILSERERRADNPGRRSQRNPRNASNFCDSVIT